MHLSYVKQEGGGTMKIAWMVDLPAHFDLALEWLRSGRWQLELPKIGATHSPLGMSADQTLRAATRPRQFSGGAIAATRLFLGLLLGPLGMAGLAGLGCPGGLTFQVEPGATLQECDGYWANSQRRRPALPTTRVSLQSKTAARCHCHRLLSCIASRYHLLCDSILRISHDIYPSAIESRLRIFRPVPSSRNRPNILTVSTLASFNDDRPIRPNFQNPKEKAVPVVTTNRHAIIHREQPTEARSYIGNNNLVDQNSSPSGS